MLLKQNFSAPLKFVLSAFLLAGCDSESKSISNEVGYLTADLNVQKAEVSEFVGTVVSEGRSAGESGVLNLEVKVESNKGETIEFMIVDYQVNKVYTLKEASFNDDWENFPIAESSGSFRHCVAGRFFFDLKAHGSSSFPKKKERYIF